MLLRLMIILHKLITMTRCRIYGAGNSDNGSYLIGLLIKMDMKGNLFGQKPLAGTGNMRFENLKVAPNGNIIVVGERMLSSLLCNEIIACYDANGNLLGHIPVKSRQVKANSITSK